MIYLLWSVCKNLGGVFGSFEDRCFVLSVVVVSFEEEGRKKEGKEKYVSTNHLSDQPYLVLKNHHIDRIRIMAHINISNHTLYRPANGPTRSTIPAFLQMCSAIRARPAHRLPGSQQQPIALRTSAVQALWMLIFKVPLATVLAKKE